MTDEIIIDSPFDAHVHLRQEAMLKLVAPLTAKHFAGCVAMPNTDPPIMSFEEARDYQREIYDLSDHDFSPYIPLYFNDDYSFKFLQECQPFAVKFYPRGLTTNSQHGCDPLSERTLKVLGYMEELEIPLLVHAESPGPPHLREEYFLNGVMERWIRQFPKLKIVIEHISTFVAVYFIMDHANVYGTATPHHLAVSSEDWMGPPLDPHLFCSPVIKAGSNRMTLVDAVIASVGKKLMLGTDSAPHPVGDKEGSRIKPGVFNAPIALQVVAQVLDKAGHIEVMQDFVSGNAQRIYGITLPSKKVKLTRVESKVPLKYSLCDGYMDQVRVVPMWAGRSLDWNIEVM